MKWSIRYSWVSSRCWWTSSFSAAAEAASCPKGFSTTTRADSVTPARASPSMTIPNSDGGISR